jgi:hypothetical protein
MHQALVQSPVNIKKKKEKVYMLLIRLSVFLDSWLLAPRLMVLI